MLIGNNPGKQGGDKAPRKKMKCYKCLETGMYEKNPDHKCAALGGGRKCDYFDDNYKRRCWRCWKHGKGMIDPYTCHVTKGDRDDCNEFWPSIKGKCRPKRSPAPSCAAANEVGRRPELRGQATPLPPSRSKRQSSSRSSASALTSKTGAVVSVAKLTSAKLAAECGVIFMRTTRRATR